MGAIIMPTIKKRGSVAKKQEPEQEIRNLAHKASEFAFAHRKYLTVIATVFAAALILLVGYRTVLSLQEQKATPLAATAYGHYNAVADPDFVKALELFRDVQKKYPSTRSGAIAQYYIGNCLADLGRNDEALKEYQAFIAKYDANKFLLGLVYERMGYVNSALGKREDAIKAFEQSESLAGPGVSTKELAMLYEETGKTIESQKKYKLIADKLAGTSWAMEAMGKVQRIASPQMPVSQNDGK
jgi:tetratricopeptide (TPR) repeat protein